MNTNSLPVYVTVYEYKGAIWPEFTREFMRHSSILVEQPDGTFDCFHVTGTPGIGLRYSCERGWGNPEDETARLLAMNEVGRMPKSKYNEMDNLMKGVATKVSRNWNCQNWVRDALGAMVANGFITEAEKEKAEKEQNEAIALPFTSETPNKRALED